MQNDGNMGILEMEVEQVWGRDPGRDGDEGTGIGMIGPGMLSTWIGENIPVSELYGLVCACVRGLCGIVGVVGGGGDGVGRGDLMVWGAGEKWILYAGTGGDAARFFCIHAVNSKDNVFDPVSVA